MATTTNYGWTTPDDTSLVKDGASAIRSLGNSIDSTLKTQIDAQIPDSIVTTKGDLISATAASTPSRLASSAVNGDVLTVDTTTATGLKWAAPATGGMTLLSTTTLNGASSYTISSIAGTYNDLYIYGDGILSTANNVNLRVNGITTSSYNYAGFATDNGVTTSTNTEALVVQLQNSAQVGNFWTKIPRYASATNLKTLHTFGVAKASSNAGWAFYHNTNAIAQGAITSITIFASANFTGGTLYLYGVK